MEQIRFTVDTDFIVIKLWEANLTGHSKGNAFNWRENGKPEGRKNRVISWLAKLALIMLLGLALGLLLGGQAR